MSGFFDKTDPTKSLKHLAFASGIGATIVWLSVALGVWGMTSNWVWSLGLFLTAITGSKIVGSGPSPAPTTGAVPDVAITTAPGACPPTTGEQP